MNLEAEIKWIQSELSNVRDPHLIEAFKQLLTYRKEKQTLSMERLDSSLERSFSDKEASRVKPHDEIRDKYKKWL